MDSPVDQFDTLVGKYVDANYSFWKAINDGETPRDDVKKAKLFAATELIRFCRTQGVSVQVSLERL